MNRKLLCVLIVALATIPVAVLAAYTDSIIMHVDTGNLLQNGDGYQVVSDEGYYIPITYPPQILYDSDVNLRDGLVAYWDMDETSGVRYDSHWANNLTDNNTVGYSAGKIGNAASAVLSNNEYLNKLNLVTAESVTAFGWLKAESSIRLIIDNGGGEVYVNSMPGYIGVRVLADAADCDYEWNGSYTTSNWNFVVVTHDYISKAATLWVNGSEAHTLDFSICGDWSQITGIKMFDYETGQVDESGIYSRTLTAAEIHELYNDGSGLSYSDFAPSYNLDDEAVIISSNSTWSARLLWTPTYSATADWPTSGAILLDTRGSSDSERVKLSFDESDNAYHVYINGADRLVSPAQTFAAGVEQDIVVSLSFNGDEYALYVNGVSADTDTTILGAPGLSTWYIGGDYTGETTANAIYSEFTIFDDYLDPTDVADLYGQSMTRSEAGGGDDLTTDLVSYWQLEETSGTRADAWGDNDLTDNNTVSYATGVISNAATFASSNAEYLSHNNNTSLDTGNIDFSVFGFAYMDTLTNTGIIERSGEYSLRYDGTLGRWAFTVADSTCATETTVYATDTPVVTGTWYAVIGWHDTEGYLGLRVDHTEYVIPYTDGVCDSSTTGNVFWVGRSDAGYHNGRLDEIAFWKRVLTPTERLYIVKGYLNDMRPNIANPSIELPFVARGYAAPEAAITPTPFPYASPTPASPFTGIDYSGDTSWSDWAKIIEEFFAPLFINIDAAETGLDELRGDVCGAGFSEGAGFIPGESYDYPVEAELGENPTILDVAYSYGMALGRPFAWIRALYGWLPTVNSQYNVVGINFFVMLIYFLTGGIVWIVFVIIVTYSMYFIRSVIDLAIKIYELIPFKST